MMFDWMEPWAQAALAWDIQLVAHADAGAWQQRRERRLRDMLGFAARRARLHAGAPPDDGGDAMAWLARWPVLHKRELMQRFDDSLTDPTLSHAKLCDFMADRRHIGQLVDGRAMVWESSGSSGEPGLFVHDREALRVYDQLEALRRPPVPVGLGSLAFVGATQGHFASVCTIERLRHLHPLAAAYMRSFSFMQPIERLVDELNRYRPAVLAAYPSTAALLAEEQLAGRLTIRPRSVWTGGETLTAAVRHLVRRAFGAPVINSYGASEFLAIGCECGHGAMHLNADWVILEPVDTRGRPAAPGHFGVTTLLTNLANRLQPLIRYDIGDRVRMAQQPCACGSPLPVIEVEGRSDDSLLLRDTRGRAVRIPPLALVSLLENDVGVFDFQLVQTADDRLRLDLCASGAAGTRHLRTAHRAVAEFLRSHGCGSVELTGRCGVHQAPGHSGKMQRIVVARARRSSHRKARAAA